MKFPSAYKAVKKLFIAEILSIAVSVVALVAGVLAIVGVANPNGSALISAGTLALVSALAMIAVFVLQLVAMIQGGKDADGFKTALWVTLIAIGVSIASGVLQSIEATKGLTVLISVLNAFVDVAHVIVIYVVLTTIAELASALKNETVAEKGRRLAFYVILMFAASILLSLVPSFFNADKLPDFVKVMFAVFALVAAVIELLIYINILVFYKRSLRTLKK